MGLALADIEKLFADHGGIEYSGEGVSQLEHALQAADFAEKEGAGDALVTAALLHDLGHLLNLQGETPTARGIDDQHQYFSIPFLRSLFPPAVIEPIRLHVDAKRALCALEPEYYEALSEDSKRSAFRGFEAQPQAAGRCLYARRDGRLHVEALRRRCDPRAALGRRGEGPRRDDSADRTLPRHRRALRLELIPPGGSDER